ncbi:MAG TPA: methyltransferase domain-containing protein [Blastocatellia bacterium]|nr:methyltransferase domain-containing protein [Blastocatellia bacterium]
MLRRIEKRLQAFRLWRTVRTSPRFRRLLGYEQTLWTRKVADEETRKLINTLDPASLSALEISGRVWEDFGFNAYHNVAFPAFDICKEVLDESFDLVIAEHIFEHLLYPYKAGRNVHRMLKPGGHFLLVTPFIYKVHADPHDCTRWTEEGLRHFLAECGFDLNHTRSGSWGNRNCIDATFKREFRLFNRYLHDLTNETDYPMVVWALAKKDDACL